MSTLPLSTSSTIPELLHITNSFSGFTFSDPALFWSTLNKPSTTSAVLSYIQNLPRCYNSFLLPFISSRNSSDLNVCPFPSPQLSSFLTELSQTLLAFFDRLLSESDPWFTGCPCDTDRAEVFINKLEYGHLIDLIGIYGDSFSHIFTKLLTHDHFSQFIPTIKSKLLLVSDEIFATTHCLSELPRERIDGLGCLLFDTVASLSLLLVVVPCIKKDFKLFWKQSLDNIVSSSIESFKFFCYNNLPDLETQAYFKQLESDLSAIRLCFVDIEQEEEPPKNHSAQTETDPDKGFDLQHFLTYHDEYDDSEIGKFEFVESVSTSLEELDEQPEEVAKSKLTDLQVPSSKRKYYKKRGRGRGRRGASNSG
ncbi:hypothetical protein P9112_002449 [Eukaryota sp. TZLM1-RC]